MIELLFGKGVRGYDVERVALHRAYQLEGDSRAAAGIFDDRAARLQSSIGLGRLDHRQRHAILHAAGRILAFELQQDASSVGGDDMAQRQQRRVADGV